MFLCITAGVFSKTCFFPSVDILPFSLLSLLLWVFTHVVKCVSMCGIRLQCMCYNQNMLSNFSAVKMERKCLSFFEIFHLSTLLLLCFLKVYLHFIPFFFIFLFLNPLNFILCNNDQPRLWDKRFITGFSSLVSTLSMA